MRCTETFRKDPAGNQPRPEKVANHPEASLGWRWSNPPLRSVDSEWAGRVMEPRNCVVAGVDTVQIVEDNAEAQ